MDIGTGLCNGGQVGLAEGCRGSLRGRGHGGRQEHRLAGQIGRPGHVGTGKIDLTIGINMLTKCYFFEERKKTIILKVAKASVKNLILFYESS